MTRINTERHRRSPFSKGEIARINTERHRRSPFISPSAGSGQALLQRGKWRAKSPLGFRITNFNQLRDPKRRARLAHRLFSQHRVLGPDALTLRAGHPQHFLNTGGAVRGFDQAVFPQGAEFPCARCTARDVGELFG